MPFRRRVVFVVQSCSHGIRRGVRLHGRIRRLSTTLRGRKIRLCSTGISLGGRVGGRRRTRGTLGGGPAFSRGILRGRVASLGGGGGVLSGRIGRLREALRCMHGEA